MFGAHGRRNPNHDNYPRMTFEVHNVDCYPTTMKGAVQHNAWWDAMALRHTLTQLLKGQDDAE